MEGHAKGQDAVLPFTAAASEPAFVARTKGSENTSGEGTAGSLLRKVAEAEKPLACQLSLPADSRKKQLYSIGKPDGEDNSVAKFDIANKDKRQKSKETRQGSKEKRQASKKKVATNQIQGANTAPEFQASKEKRQPSKKNVPANQKQETNSASERQGSKEKRHPSKKKVPANQKQGAKIAPERNAKCEQ
jgi:hypothetical protein